jgi:hypothetical protein
MSFSTKRASVNTKGIQTYSSSRLGGAITRTKISIRYFIINIIANVFMQEIE